MDKKEITLTLTEIAVGTFQEFPAISGVIFVLLAALAMGREEYLCECCAEVGQALRIELERGTVTDD